MKFTKEVSVCIIAAALSVVTESSLVDTSMYMASSLKLNLKRGEGVFISTATLENECKRRLNYEAITMSEAQLQKLMQCTRDLNREIEKIEQVVLEGMCKDQIEQHIRRIQLPGEAPTTTSSMRFWAPSGDKIKSRAVKAAAGGGVAAAVNAAADRDNKRALEERQDKELLRIIAEDKELNRNIKNWEFIGLPLRNKRNYKFFGLGNTRNAPAPRESWMKRNPNAALFLGVMSIIVVSLAVSVLIALLIAAEGGPIIRPSVMDETGH